MQILDTRRLTGLNLDLAGPGALAEVDFGDAVARVAGFARFVSQIRVFLPDAAPVMRPWPDGGKASIAFEAPIDRLYAVVNLVEKVLLRMAEHPDWVEDAAEVAAVKAHFESDIASESLPELLLLQNESARHGVPFLWDDDEVSLGFGASTRIWPARELPTAADIAALPWSDFRDIPKVFITGTNGKTTTSRMAARIFRTAGHRVGATSTDALTLDEAILERGDWTGPGAARRVLRHPAVTAAILETARGGMLRRGLGVAVVDAAVVTNVGADHFGDHGIADLSAMAATKATVWKAAMAGRRRVVNAECDASFGAARDLGPVRDLGLDPDSWVLFAFDDAHPRLVEHRAAGGETWSTKDNRMTHSVGAETTTILDVTTIPAAWGGLARHNIANALAAAATAHAAGVGYEAIARGLATFGANPDDNPGRAELWRVGPLTLMLDFGHNAHGISALAPLVAGVRRAGARLSVTVGQAGDRSDGDLVALVDAVLALNPDRVLVRPLPGYERGRAPGEVEGLLEAAFVERGPLYLVVARVDSEVAALDVAMGDARPGDMALHLVHIERQPVREQLSALGAVAGG